MKKFSITLAIIFAAAISTVANPIALPTPANTPLENIHVQIKPDADGLSAVVTGNFTFTSIPADVNSMLFPLPTNATNIHVWQLAPASPDASQGSGDDVELAWAWSSEKYTTILPEMSKIPMIQWQGPFPAGGAVLRVDYQHSLITRPVEKEFVFFYALGTGKYFPTFDKTTTANFDILIPTGYEVKGVWLDKTDQKYEVADSHLKVRVESKFGPIRNDLIVSLVPGKPGLNKYYIAYDNPIEPNAPGYTLPVDLKNVSNYAAIDSRFTLDDAAQLLIQNGFAIIEHDFGWSDPNRDDIVKPYKNLQRMDVPLFITADTLLHLYHIQFDETLKDIEEREFHGDIRDLTAALLGEAQTQYQQYTGDLKEAAKRNIAYLAVAQKLIGPEAQVPDLVTSPVTSELAKIEAHQGFADSDIFIYQEDYSQYVPRGHYTRSEELKQYFKTLMWYGRMAFLLKGAENWGPAGDALISVLDAKIQTMQAVLLAQSIEQVTVGYRNGREVWDRIYAITSFYVGLADDLTPYEYLEAINNVFGSGFVPTDLQDENNLFILKTELALMRSPQIFGGTGNVLVTPPVTPESLDEVLDKTKGMRFMGQRFIPDSYMFQQLVFPEVGGPNVVWSIQPFTGGFTGVRLARCYPRGLDVMALLGSDRAKAILIAEGDTNYDNYWQQFNTLKAEFNALDINAWNKNLYWGWLYSLRALIGEFGQGYPNFMRTEAWQKKELNAALASWTQLRHDTILYAKQSYTPIETSLPPSVTGYVEPVPEFYGRLLALTRMTRQGLLDLDALSVQAILRLVVLEDILGRLVEIANKELLNQPLSEDDYQYIRGFGSTLEGAVIGVENEGLKTTLVADVHTHTAEGKVLEEAVGYVDLIIVACPTPDGSIFLAAGPVMSYYEFKHPMSDRLTDEAWRQLLPSFDKNDRPSWFQQLMR